MTGYIKVNMLIERSSYDKFVMRHDTFLKKLNRAFEYNHNTCVNHLLFNSKITDVMIVLVTFCTNEEINNERLK